MNKFIDWDIFNAPINEAFTDKLKDKSKGECPPFGRLLMFGALLIRSLYNLSDNQLEYQIIDRASFKCCLGLKKSNKVPDSKIFWNFCEQLINKNVILGLFKIFNETLDTAGVFANEGKILDASFLEVPRKCNTREENTHRKETGTAPKEWDAKPNKKDKKMLMHYGHRKTRLHFTATKTT
ncbi:MAG: transposase [Chloroflexi bacterium]|nr:transposase [Chloroflexota bacterium]